MNRSDVLDQVVTALMGCDGTYDPDAITDQIILLYGCVDVDTINPDVFWELVAVHATAATADA